MATGVRRIIDEYKESVFKPSFDINENSIKIVLPILEKNASSLSGDERKIHSLLKENVKLSRLELDRKTGYNKSRTLRIINRLEEKQVIKKKGKGPGTTYTLK